MAEYVQDWKSAFKSNTKYGEQISFISQFWRAENSREIRPTVKYVDLFPNWKILSLF